MIIITTDLMTNLMSKPLSTTMSMDLMDAVVTTLHFYHSRAATSPQKLQLSWIFHTKKTWYFLSNRKWQNELSFFFLLFFTNILKLKKAAKQAKPVDITRRGCGAKVLMNVSYMYPVVTVLATGICMYYDPRFWWTIIACFTNRAF